MPDITSKEGIPLFEGSTMFAQRILRDFVLTVGALTGLACGDYSRSTSPLTYNQKLLPPTLTVRASYSALTSGTKARAVRWGSAHVRVDQTISAVIGPEGGTLALPGSDFTMDIPSGALESATTITVVAKVGPYVSYEMLPHGLKFGKGVTVVQGLQNTALYGTDAANAIRTAYLPEGSETVGADDSVSPSELQAATTYFYGAKPVAEAQAWTIHHFSRYILISGVLTCIAECGH
jgi:hypothetical protein